MEILLNPEPTHISPPLKAQLTGAENNAGALEAMKRFIQKGDEAVFEDAVAIYVTSARTRGESIENVLGVLCELG
ncbi:MAG: hypothetical protein M3037_05805 [Gemmatimonadota bacterium]|nr:hypothetical protein [Gemmatimonadota bacterium]